MYGQTSIIIVVALIASIMILWTLNTYNQSTTKTRIIISSEIEKINHYIDLIKGFSINALHLATQKSFNIDAAKARTFYCNGPVVPSTKVILHDIEILTNSTFNDYIKKIRFSDPLFVFNITPYICNTFSVDENKLRNGIYDQSFNVSAFGSFIEAKYGENKILSSNEIKDETIVRNRFWYLYRGFKKWSEETRVFDNVCSCLTKACHCETINCGDDCKKCNNLYVCMQDIILKSVEELDKIFNDGFIECKAYLDTCLMKMQDKSCKMPSSCSVWSSDECFECEFDNEESSCIEDFLTYGLARAQSVTTPTMYKCFVSTKTVDYKAKIIYSCVDKKYALPLDVSPEERFLNYKITVYLSFESNGICPDYIETDTPPADSCSCEEILPLPIPPLPPGRTNPTVVG
ncbi:MAG: hypothetical protein QXZ43_03680 [Candidatus Aenigmatarchaeota archaeon]